METSSRELNQHILTMAYLLGLLMVAIGLRFYGITDESIWFDEAFSIRFAGQSVANVLVGETNNPPLYFLLLHGWIDLFGTSELAVRSLSAIFGCLAILITWLVGHNLFSARIAWLSAGIMAISSFQVYYSQEARCFTLLLFLVLAATYALIRSLAENRLTVRLFWFAVYIGTSSLALYSHYFAVFSIVGQAIFVVINTWPNRKRLWEWVVVYAIGAIVSLPIFIRILVATVGGGQQRKHLLLKLPQTFFSLIFGDSLIPMDQAAKSAIGATLTMHWYYLVTAIVALGVLWAMAFIRLELKQGLLLILCCGFFPILLTFIVSFRLMIFEERYLIATSPFLLFLTAAGADSFWVIAKQKWLKSVVAVAVVMFAGLQVIGLYNNYWHPRFGKDQWREAAAYVDRLATPTDLVVFHAAWMTIPFDYYSQQDTLTIMEVHTPEEVIGSPEWQEFLERTQSFRRLIFVKSHCPTEVVLDELKKHYSVIETRHFPKANGIDIYIMTTSGDAL